MSFTAAELEIVNMSLAAIGATRIASVTDTASANAVQCLLHYTQTRDALLRSINWNFAKKRSQLQTIKTLVLDASPAPEIWGTGDVIFGLKSGSTATVLGIISPTEYEIGYLSDDFVSGERITNGDVEPVYWEGLALEYEDESVYWWEAGSSDDVVCGDSYPVTSDRPPAFEWEYQYALPSDFMRLDGCYPDGTNESWQIEGNRYMTNSDEVNLRYIRKVTDPSEFDPLFVEILVLQLGLKLIPSLAGTLTQERRKEMKEDLADAMYKASAISASENKESLGYTWENVRLSGQSG